MSWERPLLFIVHAGGTTGCLTRWNLQGRLLQLVHSRYKAKPPKSKLKKSFVKKTSHFAIRFMVQSVEVNSCWFDVASYNEASANYSFLHQKITNYSYPFAKSCDLHHILKRIILGYEYNE